MPKTNIPGEWTAEQILAELWTRNAMSAAGGRPCPVAVKVAQRVEIRLAAEEIARNAQLGR